MALEELERVQSELMSSPTEALVAEESMARDTWVFFASTQESFFKLKSRIRWLREGDSNTKFFRRVVLANQSWNVIWYLRNSMRMRIYKSTTNQRNGSGLF